MLHNAWQLYYYFYYMLPIYQQNFILTPFFSSVNVHNFLHFNYLRQKLSDWKMISRSWCVWSTNCYIRMTTYLFRSIYRVRQNKRSTRANVFCEWNKKNYTRYIDTRNTPLYMTVKEGIEDLINVKDSFPLCFC